MRRPVFGVVDQVRHKPHCKSTEGGEKLEILDLEKKDTCSSIYVAKTKAQISCAVSAQLICTFVFADAKRRFSHDPTQL